MIVSHNRGRGWWVWVALFALGCRPALAANAIELAPGWRYQVYAAGLAAVDNLAVADDGSVFASLERSSGRGQVVHLRNGRVVATVIARLNRPDGLHLVGRRLYVTEEVSPGRVLEHDLVAGTQRTVAVLRNPEGIVQAADGSLLIAEDSVNGRVVRRRPDGDIDTLIDGLNRPEGLALAADGVLYIAETATGRVLSYRAGVVRTVLEGLTAPDQLKLAADGSLWITEDSRRGRLLRLREGTLEVIASGLSRPQGIGFISPGQVLVAEQGRSRILRFTSGVDESSRE